MAKGFAETELAAIVNDDGSGTTGTPIDRAQRQSEKRDFDRGIFADYTAAGVDAEPPTVEPIIGWTADGELVFGPGGATTPDVGLKRTASGELSLTDGANTVLGKVSGPLEFIASATPSGGTISLSSLSISGYSRYDVALENIQVDTDDVFPKLRINNRSTAGDYNWASRVTESGGTNNFSSTSGDTELDLLRPAGGGGIGNAAGEQLSGVIRIYPPRDDVIVVEWALVWALPDGEHGTAVGGGALIAGTHSDVTDLDLILSSGNIDAGTIYVYGVQNS